MEPAIRIFSQQERLPLGDSTRRVALYSLKERGEPRRVLEELSDIRLVDVVLPTRSGGTIRRRCVSRRTEHQQILLEKLGLRLPKGIIQNQM